MHWRTVSPLGLMKSVVSNSKFSYRRHSLTHSLPAARPNPQDPCNTTHTHSRMSVSPRIILCENNRGRGGAQYKFFAETTKMRGSRRWISQALNWKTQQNASQFAILSHSCSSSERKQKKAKKKKIKWEYRSKSLSHCSIFVAVWAIYIDTPPPTPTPTPPPLNNNK